MKKFLLLFVGVLFALSAKAYTWVLYVDIQNTNWITAETPNPTVYFYCGESSGQDVQYWGKQTGTRVYGTIYKFSFSWGDGKLTHGIFSTNGTYSTDKGEAHYDKVNGTDTYGELDINASSEYERWKLTPNRLYVLAKGTNDIASYTDNFAPSASKDIYIVGQSIGWLDNNKNTKFTRTGEYTYEYVFTDKSFPEGNGGKFLILEGKSYDNKWGGSARIYPNVEYTLTKGGGDINPAELIENPTVLLDVTDANSWKITFKTASTPTPDPDPTPIVETSYTIYFDTLQSGWRKVALFNDGVEVVGSLEKRGYIHGANEDGVEGYLHKYTVNTTDPTKLTFTNGTDSYSLKTITDGNVYYVSGSKLAGAALASYKVNANPSYRLHGSILGNPKWDTYKMTYFDGLWIYEADSFVAGNFGIKEIEPDKAVSGDNTWIHASSSDANAVTLGVTTQGKVKESGEGDEYNFSSSVTGKLTLVFDPANTTVMFINPAAATTNLTQVEVDTYSHANKLEVTITPSNYTSTTGDLTLSNGTFTATSSTGTFSNVPYASNYTLTTSNGTAMPINITMPAEPTFNISGIYPTVVEPAAGQTNGILSVAFKVSTTWAYNLPHVICTCNGAVVPGEVSWAEGGFAFVAADAVPLTGTAVATDMTFKFVITPEYPFMVNSASTRGQMRVAGTGIQNVLGTPITNAEATLTGGKGVSGIEGLVIEAEDAPVEYFNLQGQRVDGDLAPGIYIRRQGSTVSKVRI